MTDLETKAWYRVRGQFEGILFYSEDLSDPFRSHKMSSDNFILYSTGKKVDKDLCVRIVLGPMEDLPLYLNTPYAMIAEARLKDA